MKREAPSGSTQLSQKRQRSDAAPQVFCQVQFASCVCHLSILSSCTRPQRAMEE